MSILYDLKPLLQSSTAVSARMNWDAWVADQEERADKVKLYREYADGEHRANLTPEMRAMLRIPASQVSGSPFNANHCDNIITSMTDRLELTRIEALIDKDIQATDGTAQRAPAADAAAAPKPQTPTEAANAWVESLLERNRFDAMQVGVNEATARDGDTFIMVSFDNATGHAVFSHEPAFDGTSGMLLVYASARAEKPTLAINIWPQSFSAGDQLDSAYRVNFLFADRVEKYLVRDSKIEKYSEPGEAWPAPWTLDGQPLGVPIIHSPNRPVRYTQFGKSELDDVIPLQDALNRSMVSMVMSAELAAFMIRIAKGFIPPAGITPGMWIVLNAKDAKGNPMTSLDEGAMRWLQSTGVDVIEAGEIQPYIDEQKFLIEQIYTISGTPLPNVGGDSASGESLKQRDIRLLGKVKRAQIQLGNAWEDAVAMAHRVERAFGDEPPPAYSRFYARWAKAEIRNDKDTVDNALKIADYVDERTLLEALADVYGWDAAKIDRIIESKQTEGARKTTQALSLLPGFGGGVSTDRLAQTTQGGRLSG